MNFDWLAFVKRHRIPFIEEGKNVARDHINIRCPFCGAGDPSHHMGLSLVDSRWACWRSPDHRGADPVRLGAALLHMSRSEARVEMDAKDVVPVHSLAEMRSRLLSKARGPESMKPIDWPDEFVPLTEPVMAR